MTRWKVDLSYDFRWQIPAPETEPNPWSPTHRTARYIWNLGPAFPDSVLKENLQKSDNLVSVWKGMRWHQAMKEKLDQLNFRTTLSDGMVVKGN